MSKVEALQDRAREVEALLLPGERAQISFLSAVSAVLRTLLLVSLPLGLAAGAGWGLMHGHVAGGVVGLIAGGCAGLLPELLRRTLIVDAYRAVLSRVGVGALQAAGGTTSVALPALAAPKASAGAAASVPFVVPVRPPPRVGDPDADDFDD
jgi:hypothetical protein